MTKRKLLNYSIALAAFCASSLAVQPAPAKHSKSSKHSKQTCPKQCGMKSGEKCDKKNDSATCKKDRKAMKITLTKSGGIMGMMKVYVVDSKTLSDENSAKLLELIDTSKIINLKSQTTPGAADMFFYEFKIEDGSKTTNVTFDDGAMPESVRPLMKFLFDMAPGENVRKNT